MRDSLLGAEREKMRYVALVRSMPRASPAIPLPHARFQRQAHHNPLSAIL